MPPLASAHAGKRESTESAILNGPTSCPRRGAPDAAYVPRSSPLNGRPLSLSRPTNRTGEPEPLRHVIDQYKHREQTITCVCGWHGSCATNQTGGSDWTTHLNQFRTKRK